MMRCIKTMNSEYKLFDISEQVYGFSTTRQLDL